jgi:hypothetical protein
MREKRNTEMFCVACNAYSTDILRELNGEDEKPEKREAIEVKEKVEQKRPTSNPSTDASSRQTTTTLPKKPRFTDTDFPKDDRCREYEIFLWNEMDQMKEQVSSCLSIETKVQMIRYLKECAECLQAIRSLDKN